MAKPNQKYLDTTTYLSAEFTSGEDVVPIVLVDPDTGEPYVPGGGGGTVTGAINGLSLDGTNVILGGSALDRATTITGAGQSLAFTGLGSFNVNSDNTNPVTGTQTDINISASAWMAVSEGTGVATLGDRGQMDVTPTGVGFTYFDQYNTDPTSLYGFNAGSGVGIYFVDTIDNKGVKYLSSASYSATNWATDDDYIPSIGLIKANVASSNIYTADGQITSNRSVLATASENFSLGFSATPSEVFNLLQLGGTNVSIYGLSAGLPTGFLAITPTTTEINSDVATGTTLISGNNITATATATNQVIGSVVDLDASNNLTADAVNNVTVTAQNGAITLQDNLGANYLYIDGTGFDLFGTDVGGTGDTIQVTGFAGDFDVAADNSFSLTSSDSATTSTVSAQGGLTLQSTDLDLTIQNTGANDINFIVGSGAMLVSGSGSFEGFKYVADIRANLVDKSLVPKDYVDPRFDVSASSASYTPNADSNDGTTLTALATNLTINAPTGTPKEGQKYVIKIKDDGTSRTLTWDAIYQDNWAGGTINTLPTATTIGKWHRLEFEYNSTDTKWDVISIREKV